MNDIISALILAIVQGIAEWIPISSSAHLVLASRLLDFDNTLLFDVALHFGTLMAVFVYFGNDIVNILKDVLSFKFKTENGKLGVLLIIGAIPAAIFGFLLRNIVENNGDNLFLIAIGLLITSLILFIGSMGIGKRKIGLEKLGYFGAFLIGLAQVLSLFRGISRSGGTITSGLLLGLDMKDAVKFSFLLSIPVIFGANIVTIGNQTLPHELLWATLVSFLVGLCMINISFKYILVNRKNLKWFGVYTLLLALGILVYLTLR